ncbi:MAG: class GN sortase [Alphaproteobacteria bacterium HGW-Alphaproteobacteria-11]|nr:MAG: class GN sortase [Alphaproteobacteria bacterium HGW-Alphaproteobacteria-11]
MDARRLCTAAPVTAPGKNAAALLWAAAIALCLGFGIWQAGQGVYIKAKAELAQVLLERAWQRTLIDGNSHKAWPWADTWPVAMLEAPAHGRRQIVLSNASGEALAFGPGHLLGSPLPGAGGTSVIAGHRDTHFSFLRNLKSDDVVILTTANGLARRYVVDGTDIVDARLTQIDPSAETGIALVTCYPFDATERGDLRYIVFATPEPDAI